MKLNGEEGQFCSKCGRWIGKGEATMITASSRKNPHAGRIAWWRDGVCRDCAKKEEDEKGGEPRETD